MTRWQIALAPLATAIVLVIAGLAWRSSLIVCVVWAAIVCILSLAVYGFFRRSLPQTHGERVVLKLGAPIEITRDRDAIPHIFASSKQDAWFGLGYVHAQDRLWQMDFQRRIGRGRVAEVLGKRGVPFDLLSRTIGFARVAERAWGMLTPPARDAVEAYSAGVNAFLAQCGSSRLPPEYHLLRCPRPEAWSGPDSVLFSILLGWNLAGNYPSELLRQRLCEAVGEARTRELMPPYREDTLLRLAGAVQGDGSAANAVLPVPGTEPWNSFGEGAGSNLWAVGPEKTESGGAVLANDPHLPSTNPMTWYLAHVSAPGLEAIGATTPGIPGVILGRNQRIAWGITNLNPDVQDFYRERIDPSGEFGEFRGSMERMERVDETIRVRNGAAVQLSIRSTRHGPLARGIMGLSASGTTAGATEPLSFRWTGLDPANVSLEAFLRLNEAQDWQSFRAAIRLCASPAVNFGYADIDGNFGFHASGKIPLRNGYSGAAPANGWSGDNEWTGFIPFEELPHALNPACGFVAIVNTAPPDPAYPYLLSTDWVEPYRLERMNEVLSTAARLSDADHAALQADTLSLYARHSLPALLALVTPEPDTAAPIAMLRTWNCDATGGSAAAAIFAAWTLELPRALLREELPADLLGLYEAYPSWACRYSLNAIEGRTSANGKAAEAASKSLRAALTTLRRHLGKNTSSWRWASIHRAVFPHSPLNTRPVLRPVFSLSVPLGGDWSTVNIGGILPNAPFQQRYLAGYRQIVDLSQPTGRFIHATGQSGHFLSRHFSDFLTDWAAVRYRSMRFDRTTIHRDAAGTLRLKPFPIGSATGAG